MRLLRCLAGAGAVGLLLYALPACPRTANIDDIYTALDGNGDRKRNVFFTDTTELHCVAEVGAGRSDVTVNLRIRAVQLYDFTQGKLVDTDRIANPPGEVEFVPTAGPGLQKLDLALAKKNDDGGAGQTALPVGRFQCEALLDGEVKLTAIFNIQFPECPAASIDPGSVCAKFFEPGRQCPAFGATSSEAKSCTCDYQKGWQCPP